MRSRFVAALSLSLLACSAIATFDGLVGDSTSSDGGADANGASADGGGADGASMVSDGGVSDVVAMVDTGGSPGYCATHPGHTFCDDFDPGNGLGSRWSSHIGMGTVVTSIADPLSPPRALLATSPANDGGTNGENDAEKTFSASQSLAVEAAVKLALTTPSADFLAISFTPTDTSLYSSCYFDLSYANPNVVLEANCSQPDGGSYYASTTVATTQPNWDRVHLGVDLAGAQVTGSMSGAAKTLPLPAGLATTKLTALAGVVYREPGAGTVSVRVDNVVIDAL